MSLDQSRLFLDLLDRHDFNFFTGVPCSYFAGVMDVLRAEPRYGYVGAVREDSALGLAVGAWLGGRRPVVFMQNSGLAVATNALHSLAWLYNIPALLVISWRGKDGRDAPEHLLMGRVLPDYLKLSDIPYETADPDRLSDQITVLSAALKETLRPVALVVPEGVLS